MALDHHECDGDGEEDYIDMELASSSSREFEFKMGFTCNDKETATYPADELFYKGKLLPLLLPSRRLRVLNLFSPTADAKEVAAATAAALDNNISPESDFCRFSMPLNICPTAPCRSSVNSPLDISPTESCRVSCEMNPDEYFEWSTELSNFINSNDHQHLRKPWTKRLKRIKYSNLGQKLRASRAYLKSWFAKSVSSHKISNKGNADSGPEHEKLSKEEEELSSKYTKIYKKKPFGSIATVSCPPAAAIASIIKNMDKDGSLEDNNHRRSFSGALKRHSPSKCLSTSSSNSSSSSSSSSASINSNAFPEPRFPWKSTSVTEIESSIEAAIAHCRKSPHVVDPEPKKS